VSASQAESCGFDPRRPLHFSKEILRLDFEKLEKRQKRPAKRSAKSSISIFRRCQPLEMTLATDFKNAGEGAT
jgi:hypothetical protein